MKQFLIREFIDSTGHVHVNVEQPRENERMTLVEAWSEEEAKEKHMKIIELSKCPICKQLGRNLVAKDYDSPIEYMECKHCGHEYYRLGGKHER
ncbi:hypothetical protein HMPREF2997_00955 [Staphylococcus sp. HMSC057C08]|uniref:DUF1381 domain-containing protein n=1 Tax=Staphylococcus sp. HMSC057C08 TaxID=1739501 RepID=UPI0008A17934|nr:DUF1381 domain-containing protein [Staphylococcus sp. HMSC057C08]OFP20961.1 hypothetical protein HMPREF2997_00955 [Staphylococcus sp. HMSC057C08]